MAANSNPEAEQFQSQTVGGVSIAQQMVDACAELNRSNSQNGVGDTGVVVGATVARPPRLDELNAVVLMPGVGAQGATLDDVSRVAGDAAHLVFPNVSRSVLAAGPDARELRKRARELAKR